MEEGGDVGVATVFSICSGWRRLIRTAPYEHHAALTETMDERSTWNGNAIRQRAQTLRRAAWHGTKLSVKFTRI